MTDKAEKKRTIQEALLAAQKEIAGAKKDGENPHHKSHYPTLPSVIDAVKSPLNNEGFLITQPLHYDAETEQWVLETVLTYTVTNETISAMMPIVAKDMSDPQKWGSAITYARRYTLQSLVTLPAADDDGNKPAADSLQQSRRPAKTLDDIVHSAIEKDVLRNEIAAIAAKYSCSPGVIKEYVVKAGYESSNEMPLNELKQLRDTLARMDKQLVALGLVVGSKKALEWLEAQGGLLETNTDEIAKAIDRAENQQRKGDENNG